MAFNLIIVYDSHFILNWIYLFLDSLNFKNEKLRVFVKIYSYLVCKYKIKQDKETVEQDGTKNKK